MADALLGILIQNLGSFVQEELATYLGVGELTQSLSRKLTLIRAVLKDAEKKQITNDAVKEWLQQLRDAAYVLDDILDECSITLKAHGNNKRITRFHPMKILVRRNIGKRMKEIAKEIDDIAEERMKFGLHVGVIERQPEDEGRRQTTSVITESKVYGRDKDKEHIVEFLLRHAGDSEELSVYSIVGHGGYGKTTLAQTVFNDERVKTHFDLKIWVCVSGDINAMKVLESIIENTIGKNPHLSSLESMQQKVQEILQKNRYLLVLDDVWTEDKEKWNKLKSLLLNGKKGASILITTRLDIVASIMGTSDAHHLASLSDDDIWSLFKQQAFGENREERAELVAIGKKLVRKCVGSPLAAKVLGSSLCCTSNEHQWISVLESEFWNLPEVDSIMSALRISYFNLKLSLRPCFAFCAVFPKGFEMVKENLIHLWMANGLVTSRGNLQMEHVGDEVWNQLWQRSFFQEVKSDLADVAGNNLKSLSISKFANLKELPVELGPLTALESLSIERCNEMESFSEHLLKGLSSLRNMSVFSCSGFKSLSDGMRHLTCLETLHIYYCPQLVFPHNMNSLASLRQLLLVECNESILDGIEGIPSLQKLRLFNFPSIKSLPDWLGAMTSLQVLAICDFPELSSLPDNFQQLQNLQTLTISGCPILEKRCKRGIGEDWHKIAHIPISPSSVETTTPTKSTICENIITTWRIAKATWKILWNYNMQSSGFEEMIDSITQVP
ncbi:putative P-loop containing nucleoside triphosphate hydrolase, leucine-rich repeat domain, L [Medicago truncatula]|uniref:Putative P-loop containing nucleoside triphosphate hydrolase, leucine-rich repeat domain, L n=1 Tax=Medicago truncatula TaxID=3880 RepID=A0A396HFN8_MEDTR|nr:putative P-loop containing nucleoside triphosphate hydrolase, leucine-rich repeat domain, L [Medicago truncatula]